MKNILILFLLVSTIATYAQADLPYAEIPEYPESYTAESSVARMIDGLGFRYYWATEGLREEDLKFKPSEEARTSRETLEHIHGLTNFFVNTTRGEVQNSVDATEMSFEELRKATLANIQEASEILKSGTVTLDDLIVRFESSDMTYPYWNLINGPIADALWHVGQVVSFRRSSGNPFNSNVSVFNGKLRN
ncbi:MAG: hypothetical protein RIC35_19905 [Marinoscillum sp.]